MRLPISLELICSGIGMVMSLKHYINVICIHDRCQLCTENHSVGIGVIKTGAIDILMEHNHAPCCIRILADCLLDYILVGCTVIIVSIQHDKQYTSISIVIICSRCGLTQCVGCVCIGESVWIVKMH